MSEASFKKRGFRSDDALKQRRLEITGQHMLVGFGHAVAARNLSEVQASLETVPREFRGFAYEGAAMGLAVTDVLAPWRRSRIRAFIEGPAAAHVSMSQVGIGWAMARMPRPTWRRFLVPSPMQWLALDGYGFHAAYFVTQKHVVDQRVPLVRAPWPDPTGFAPHVVDQGIGRALWFVCAADAERVASTIGQFAPTRRPDLWGGAGLAATYAGGADTDELEVLLKLAAGHRREVALGSAFAAKTRLVTDLVTPDTAAATRVLTRLSVAEAADLTDRTLARTLSMIADGVTRPPYEVWRQQTAAEFGDVDS